MKQNKSVMYIFLEGTVAVFVILMLGLFPLYYENNFINISVAKLSFFRVCIIGLMSLIVIFAGMDWLSRYKEEMQLKGRLQQKNINSEKLPFAQRIKKWLSGFSVSTWFAVIFVVGICLATIFSVNPSESLLGKDGRKLGAIVWLFCIAMYGILGKHLKPGKWILWFFIAANTIVTVLGILNFWAIDPLHMYDNLSIEQHGSFISTIGNVNACVGYLCMVVPVGMVLYLLSKTRTMRIAAGSFLVLGFWTAYCTRCESWVLGYAAAFLVLLWFAMRDQESMQRYLEICGLFWLGSVLMKVTVSMGEAAKLQTAMLLNFKNVKFQYDIMLNGYVLAVMGILIAGAMFLIWNRKRKGRDFDYRSLRKCIFVAFVVLVAAAILLFVTTNIKETPWEGSLSGLNRLKLQESFGSYRGYIWGMTGNGWLEMPFWQKLTGYGVNCYNMFVEQYGGSRVSDIFRGARLVDAHNEFLQLLVTTGIFGAVGYFGLLVSTAVRGAKKYAKQPLLLFGTVMVCSYMAQGMANNPTIFLTPYLFLLLGIIKSLEKLEDVGE